MALLLLALAVFAPPALAYAPYHDISDMAGAQLEAQKRELPIAFLGVVPGLLEQNSPAPGSEADLSQVALNELQGRAVVITFNGHTMAGVPGFVHAQFHIADDGPLEGGGAWLAPKIVFTDPGITKILGRVAHAQIAPGGPAAIDTVLDQIEKDPDALSPKKPTILATLQSAASDLTPESANPNPPFGRVGWVMEVVIDRWPYFLGGAAVLILALIAWAARNL